MSESTPSRGGYPCDGHTTATSVGEIPFPVVVDDHHCITRILRRLTKFVNLESAHAFFLRLVPTLLGRTEHVRGIMSLQQKST
jgi:hypothetical protein